MKNLFLCMAAMTVLALSCQKSQPAEPVQPESLSAKSTVHVELDVALDQTRALSADEKGITPNFAEGDVIYVFAKEAALGVAYDKYLGKLTNSPGNLSRFDGDLEVGYINTGDYKVGLYYNQRDPESLQTDGKPDANKMTLDAAGHVYNQGQVGEDYQVPYGNQGFYWTGSYIKPSESMSWSEIEFYFAGPNGGAEASYTGDIKLTYGSRNYGLSLRKVEEKQAAPSSDLPSVDGF